MTTYHPLVVFSGTLSELPFGYYLNPSCIDYLPEVSAIVTSSIINDVPTIVSSVAIPLISSQVPSVASSIVSAALISDVPPIVSSIASSIVSSALISDVPPIVSSVVSSSFPIYFSGSLHSNLSGLGFDDHPQYVLATGTRSISGPFTLLSSVNISGAVNTPVSVSSNQILGVSGSFSHLNSPSASLLNVSSNNTESTSGTINNLTYVSGIGGTLTLSSNAVIPTLSSTVINSSSVSGTTFKATSASFNDLSALNISGASSISGTSLTTTSGNITNLSSNNISSTDIHSTSGNIANLDFTVGSGTSISLADGITTQGNAVIFGATSSVGTLTVGNTIFALGTITTLGGVTATGQITGIINASTVTNNSSSVSGASINDAINNLFNRLDTLKTSRLIYTDYMGSTTTGNPPWIGAALSGGGLNFTPAEVSGTFGNFRHGSHSTNLNSGYRWKIPVTTRTAPGLFFFDSHYTPADTSGVVWRIGIHEGHTVTLPTHGFWFELSGGNFYARSTNTSVHEIGLSSIAASGSTQYYFLGQVNESMTAITFVLMDKLFNVLMQETLTTIPNPSSGSMSHTVLTVKTTAGAVGIGWVEMSMFGCAKPLYLP